MHSSIRKVTEKLSALRTRARVVTGEAVTQLRRNTTPGQRQTALGMVVAGVLTAGVLAGTAGLINPATPAQAGGIDATARAQAAARADRSSRAAVAPAAPKKGTSAKPAAKVAARSAPKWVSPMPGAALSSCYGPRWGTMHQGIDFAGDPDTKIYTIGSGTVLAAGWNYSGYGISVVIDHGNGYLSHYAHASRVLVHAGQRVAPGQAIALEGSTGDSTGPHLHFEIHHGLWNQIEPASWMRAHGVKVGC